MHVAVLLIVPARRCSSSRSVHSELPGSAERMTSMDLRRTLRRPRTWLIAVPVVALLAVTAGPFVYINFIKEDAPPRLGFDDVAAGDSDDEATTTTADGTTTATAPTGTTAPATTSGSSAVDASGVDGSWTVVDGSQVGYRVTEVLFGQDTEGVGRTSDVTGSFELTGTTVTAASSEVDMTTFESDESRRDSQFNGRIMEVDTFPTSTFTLTQPIDLASIPEDLVEITTTATGELTLHGTTKEVTIELVARRNGDNIEIKGSLNIVFADWGIENPSNGAVTTQDNGELELLLVLARG
jgi:polyisoprenoid-binding protein YceI